MNNAATVRREATGWSGGKEHRPGDLEKVLNLCFLGIDLRTLALDEVVTFPLFLQEATEQPQRTINVPDLDNLAPRHLGHTSSIVGGADD